MEKDRVVSFTMLARFGHALWRHLWLIIGIVALAVAAAAYLGTLESPPYQAESWLLIKTPPADPQQVNPASGDLDSMVALLTSVALEQRVLANPQSASLPAGMRHVGGLAHSIDIRGNTQPGLTTYVLKIVASGATPDEAALLANLWSDESVAFLNQYYLGDVDSLQKLQTTARANYDQAERAYQDFLNTTSIPELQAQVDALEQSMSTYLGAERGNEAGVYVQQLQAKADNLGAQYALLGKLQLALDNAHALRTAISASPAPRLADSVALASLLTTAGSLVPTGTLPVQIQMATGSAGTAPETRDQQLQDLDDLLSVLQNRMQTVQTTIAQTSQQILTTQPYTPTAALPPFMDSLIQRDRTLNQQLESAQASQKELEGQRDLYWDSYTDLSKRLIDVTAGLSRLNQVSQIVRADESLATRPAVTNRAILTTLGVSLAVMVLIVLLYELVAPGRQIARELGRWRVGRRPTAPSQ